jgi:DNA-binding protein H-NS
MTSLTDLMKQREELENKIQMIKESERQVAIDNIRNMISSHGLSPYDIFDEIPIRVEPRFMNPETGEKWSGRGKTPKWLEGKDREKFLIANQRPKEEE